MSRGHRRKVGARASAFPTPDSRWFANRTTTSASCHNDITAKMRSNNVLVRHAGVEFMLLLSPHLFMDMSLTFHACYLLYLVLNLLNLAAFSLLVGVLNAFGLLIFSCNFLGSSCISGFGREMPLISGLPKASGLGYLDRSCVMPFFPEGFSCPSGACIFTMCTLIVTITSERESLDEMWAQCPLLYLIDRLYQPCYKMHLIHWLSFIHVSSDTSDP
jgi:hypothetical protein